MFSFFVRECSDKELFSLLRSKRFIVNMSLRNITRPPAKRKDSIPRIHRKLPHICFEVNSNSKFRRDANIRKTPEIIRVIPSLRTLSDACIETRSPWRSNLVPNAVWNANGTPLERVRPAIETRFSLGYF